jgi:hypothetical protein
MKRAIAAIMVFGLCGCSSGGGALEGGQGAAEPAPPAATGPAGSGSTARSTAGPSDRGPVNVPKELCGFLANEVPKIKDKSRVVGLARFAADYAGWIGEDANRALAAASEVDKITTTTCPEIRSQVLDLLNRDTLAEILGSLAAG